MKKDLKNHAYIDGANLYNGVASLEWRLDYRRFRVWLREKYQVAEAYLFIGLIPKNAGLYTALQKAGFKLVFKEVVYDDTGKAKGNCDTDLVLQATQDCFENKCEQAIIISSDGDYASLVAFLLKRGRLRIVLSPSSVKKCSILLKKTNAPIAYLNDVRGHIQIAPRNEKAPDTDGTV